MKRKESQERKRSTCLYLVEAETGAFKSISVPVLMSSYVESGDLSLNWWGFKLAGSLAIGHPQRRLILPNMAAGKFLHPSDAANTAKISKGAISKELQNSWGSKGPLEII